jgi:hypothetical protein
MIIALANTDKVVVVDDEDYPLLSRYAWSLDHKGYAKTSAFGTTVKIHRMILNAPKDALVDHKDRDKLNNRKANLRLCDNAFNQANTDKREFIKGKPTSSKYKGVHWRKDMDKWIARLSYMNKRIHLGSFDSEEEAALAYNEKALEVWGEYANLNKVVLK